MFIESFERHKKKKEKEIEPQNKISKVPIIHKKYENYDINLFSQYSNITKKIQISIPRHKKEKKFLRTDKNRLTKKPQYPCGSAAIYRVSRRVSSSSRNSLARIEQLNNLYPANRLLSLFSRIDHRVLDVGDSLWSLAFAFCSLLPFLDKGIAVSLVLACVRAIAFHLSLAMLGTILSSTIVFFPPPPFVAFDDV